MFDWFKRRRKEKRNKELLKKYAEVLQDSHTVVNNPNSALAITLLEELTLEEMGGCEILASIHTFLTNEPEDNERELKYLENKFKI